LAGGVHIPTLRDNTVFDDTRVADQRIDSIGDHDRDRVTLVNSRGGVLLHIRARSE